MGTTTSVANIDLVKSLGADVVIDYKKDDFDSVLQGCDVVLNSQDKKTLEKSLRVLKPGGKLVSISGPPDVEFAKEIKARMSIDHEIYKLSSQEKGKTSQHKVFISFHERGRRTIKSNYKTDRLRCHKTRYG